MNSLSYILYIANLLSLSGIEPDLLTGAMKGNRLVLGVKQKRCPVKRHLIADIINMYYPFNLSSGETVSFFLPFALRAARTLLPLGVDILSLKPCLFALFLLDG